MISFNKTKIVATVGPASASAEVLESLVRAGVDVFRLNLSHGTREEHAAAFRNIRSINAAMGTHVAILADLQGPKLRIGELDGPSVTLRSGDTVILSSRSCAGTAQRLFINYPPLAADVRPGQRILMDDGRIQLTAAATNGADEVTATVMHGGTLTARKGVNLPDSRLSIPGLTEKDEADLQFALEQGADWIGLSFVRSAADVTGLKQRIAAAGRNARVVAKIEKPEAVGDIDRIVAESDALMVARGDLGVELPMRDVPLLQKKIVEKCIRAARPVIIATQMMESMITSYAPTRAEVNDVANSVLDGADAVMLSAETSQGQFPVRVVETMREIIASVEHSSYYAPRLHAPDASSPTYISDSICYNACVMAEHVGARAIMGITRSGYTAFMVSGQRPKAEIHIFTDNAALLPVLSLVWGVRAFFYDRSVGTDDTIREIQDVLKLKGLIRGGDTVIHLAAIPLGEQGRTNMIKLEKVRS
jgi:pyruvate kinase